MQESTPFQSQHLELLYWVRDGVLLSDLDGLYTNLHNLVRHRASEEVDTGDGLSES